MTLHASATLTARRVTVRFGGLDALSDVDVDLHLGEILGLIGPNGAGKTTLVNVLTGFQLPTTGEIRVNGISAAHVPPDRMTRLGVARTFQSARLFEDLTVAENVEVAAVAAGLSSAAARRKAQELLQWAGCEGWAGRQASELPYSAERLVGVARALASAPSFLLLDEPAAGMTRVEANDLGCFIKRIPEATGCGVILIEHNVRLVMEVSTRVQVLDGGRTIALGKPDEIARHPEVRRAYLGQS
jgi:branched-chain amino acid transport system ATP-binding protein